MEGDNNNDFRVATTNPFSSPGSRSIILEVDGGDEAGYLFQQLQGTPGVGAYTFSVVDVGLPSFGDNEGAVLRYGFSLGPDRAGPDFIAGSFQELVEEVDIFNPGDDGAAAFNGSVTYEADGTESQIFVVLERPAGATGRSAVVVPTTTLTFEAAPQPGDFNGDGLVNAADYTVWRDNLNEVEGVLLAGNGNNDGAVDALDYQLWRQSFIGDALMTSSSTRISTPIKAKHRRSSRPARRAAGGVKESPSGPASTVALPGR